MQCVRCAGEQFTKAGSDQRRRQIFRCTGCGRRKTDRSASAFCGYRFPDDIIALAVRWYLRFRLSYVDLVEHLAERGIQVDPSTVFDWVQHFTPLYQDAARPHRHRVGGRWSVDETYIRMAGKWVYAYRAIDEDGRVIDVYVSERRDTAAATSFLKQAVEGTATLLGIAPVAFTPPQPNGTLHLLPPALDSSAYARQATSIHPSQVGEWCV